jgi:hypothetical protein
MSKKHCIEVLYPGLKALPKHEPPANTKSENLCPICKGKRNVVRSFRVDGVGAYVEEVPCVECQGEPAAKRYGLLMVLILAALALILLSFL